MRDLWRLWRRARRLPGGVAELELLAELAERLEDASEEFRAAALMAVVETGASLEAREPWAVPRRGWEVSYWRDRNQANGGTRTKRASTLAEALWAALAEA